ncbi:hypothetical protein L0Y59_00810 [Candidatus Uhrbacteria bacterium]|nr:hypothetical protein [Candidatus Uhrbacteria bacterium]
MDAYRFIGTCIVVFATIPIHHGCRTEDGNAWIRSDASHPEHPIGPDEDAPEPDRAPDTERDPWLFDDRREPLDDDSPETLPSGTDDQTYATEIHLIPGCDADEDGSMAVAVEHARQTMCESIHAVAVCTSMEGDSFEIPTPFLWTSLRPDHVGIADLQFTNDALAYLDAGRDVFDEGDGSEPTSTVIACTRNVCPDGAPADICQPFVCGTLTVAAAVNLEGPWTLFTSYDGDLLDLAIVQEGRTLYADHGLHRGRVRGETISFEIGDVRFEGAIAPDRDHAAGDAIELMGLDVIGTWSLDRVGP